MTQSLSARIAVDLTDRIGKIHPHIYGHFIEHLRECLYKGMWAELLKNRKFTGHDAQEYGVVEPWTAVGRTPNAFFMHDNRDYYVPGMADRGQSQRIEVRQANGESHGVAQDGIGVIGGHTYEVELTLKRRGDIGPVEVTLGEGDTVARHVISDVSHDWSTHRFALQAAATTDAARFSVTFRGEGTLWLGCASLRDANHQQGWRADVLELIHGLKPPIIRYPGGNFVSGYRWQDGIGERDRRPVRYDRAWHVYEPNDVGTDEFIQLCRLLDTEPYLCVNTGDGTPEEAAAWVEYCNGPADSEYGRLRAANGHPEPYDVIYWGIGNETYGNWQIDHVDAETHAHECVTWARAMKAKDTRIKLLAVGGMPDRWPDWNAAVTRIAGAEVDYITLHHYARAHENATPEEEYLMTVTAPDRIGELIAQSRADIDANAGGKHIPISFDEWNVAHRRVEMPFRQNYALADGLYAAGFFNLMLRNADHITMANQAQLVNLLGLIETSDTDSYGTPEYLAFQLYVDHSGPIALRASVDGPTYQMPRVGNIGPYESASYLDVAASHDPDQGKLFLHVINRHSSESIEAEVAVAGGSLGSEPRVFEMNGPDVWARNSFAEHDRVKIVSRTADAPATPLRYTFPPHSATTLEISCQA